MSEQFPEEPQEVPLPLEVRVQRQGGGWSARLPLRAEFVRVDKVVETRERVSVRAHMVRDVEHLRDTVRR